MIILQTMTTVMRGQGSIGAASPTRMRDHRVAAAADEVRVRRATVSDTGAVLAMAGRCSRTTLYRRFHGFTDGVDYFTALLRHHPEHDTHLAWWRARCIGLATLAANGEGGADLGVVVEDHWQLRGIGTRLVSSLLATTGEGGVGTLHADVLSDDLFLLHALSRIGPLSVSVELGAVAVDIDIGAAGPQSQWARPHGPVPESLRGEIRVTNPSGQLSPGGGNWPPVMRRSRGTAPPSSTRAIPWITR
jgi:N-acetylglutamate synthase-like GNAT family acetyltransferase